MGREPNRRIAFCFAAASIGWLNALAVVYEIAPLSRERCKLRWTLAVSLPGLLSNIEPLIGRGMQALRSACSGRLSALLVNTLPTMEHNTDNRTHPCPETEMLVPLAASAQARNDRLARSAASVDYFGPAPPGAWLARLAGAPIAWYARTRRDAP